MHSVSSRTVNLFIDRKEKGCNKSDNMAPDSSDKKNRTKKVDTTRKRAEHLLREKAMLIQDIAPEDIPALIHELQVHQIELDLQNEELRRTKLQLEESWARYVYLYDHAPVGYYTFDGKGRIIEVNLTGSRQQGLAKDAMLKRPFSSFMSRDDGDLFYLHLKKVFATGNRQCCTLTLFQENGKPFHAQLDSIPSVLVSGENPLCQTTVTDITERKELEEALQVSETFFRRLFEDAREGILILDAETGQISDVNPFLMEMLGYSHEDFLGRKLWEIGLFKDVEEWQRLICGTAEQRMCPLQQFAAGDKKRQDNCRGIYQQCFSGEPSKSDSVPHPRCHQA